MFQNASPTSDPPDDAAVGDGEAVVTRTAQRAVARRQAAYADEVRRLLDAGLEVMRRYGTTRSPRVADVLSEAGLSRDAFYRHFASKEELVSAVVEVGGARLVGYLRHQMDKADDAEEQLRRWVRGILSQAANRSVADATRAVLWNGDRVASGSRQDVARSDGPFAELVAQPLRRLGSADPGRDAVLITYATLGLMRECLERSVVPTAEDEDHLVAFCLAAVGATPAGGTTRPGGDRGTVGRPVEEAEAPS